MYGTGIKRNTTMFHYREECLNSSRPNEFSIVGINSAIQNRRKSPSLGSVFKVYTISSEYQIVK